MENNVITQLDELFERISRKADTCLQLKVITSYHTERYLSSDGAFIYRIFVKDVAAHIWEASKNTSGEDLEPHCNLTDAADLDRYLEELILGVLEDIRAKKIALDNYLNPEALI